MHKVPLVLLVAILTSVAFNSETKAADYAIIAPHGITVIEGSSVDYVGTTANANETVTIEVWREVTGGPDVFYNSVTKASDGNGIISGHVNMAPVGEYYVIMKKNGQSVADPVGTFTVVAEGGGGGGTTE